MREWSKVMTWGEFKAFVDAQLCAEGSGDWASISYIDIRWPKHPHEENPHGMDVPSVGVHDGEVSIQ